DSEQRAIIEKFYEELPDYLYKGHEAITIGGKYVVEIVGPNPVTARARRHTPEERRFLDAEAAALVKAGILEPCGEPVDFAALAFSVPKPGADGRRLVVDYTPVNAVTADDVFPLPHVDHIVTRVAGDSYFTVFDARKG